MVGLLGGVQVAVGEVLSIVMAEPALDKDGPLLPEVSVTLLAVRVGVTVPSVGLVPVTVTV